MLCERAYNGQHRARCCRCIFAVNRTRQYCAWIEVFQKKTTLKSDSRKETEAFSFWPLSEDCKVLQRPHKSLAFSISNGADNRRYKKLIGSNRPNCHCRYNDNCITHRKLFGLPRFLPKQKTTYCNQLLRAVSGNSWPDCGKFCVSFFYNRVWFAQMAFQPQLLPVLWFSRVLLGSGVALRSRTHID